MQTSPFPFGSGRKSFATSGYVCAPHPLRSMRVRGTGRAAVRTRSNRRARGLRKTPLPRIHLDVVAGGLRLWQIDRASQLLEAWPADLLRPLPVSQYFVPACVEGM